MTLLDDLPNGHTTFAMLVKGMEKAGEQHPPLRGATCEPVIKSFPPEMGEPPDPRIWGTMAVRTWGNDGNCYGMWAWIDATGAIIEGIPHVYPSVPVVEALREQAQGSLIMSTDNSILL